jgi:hypothetical protein
MPGLGDFQPNPRIKAIIVSSPKIGKTVGAATFPRANFISFDEEGLTSLKNPLMEAKFGFSKKGIMYEVFKDDFAPNGVVKAHKALDNACRYFDACMSKTTQAWRSLSDGKSYPVGVDMFDTWVIDSGSTLVKASTNKAIILAGSSAIPGLVSSTWKKAQETGMMHRKLQDMGAERSMTEQFIDMVRRTDKHVLVLCHEREVWEGEGENAKLIAITPLFTGQSTELIPGEFNEVWWVDTRPKGPEVLRLLQTVPSQKRIAGSRLGLPNETLFEWEAIRQALKF